MSEQVMENLLDKLKNTPLVIGGKQVTLDFNELDDYHIQKAERELRETPELVQESFKILCDMLGGQIFLFNFLSLPMNTLSSFEKTDFLDCKNN
jgi:hypothetical protein